MSLYHQGEQSSRWGEEVLTCCRRTDETSFLPFFYKSLNLLCSHGHIMVSITTVMNTSSFPANCASAQNRSTEAHLSWQLPSHPGLASTSSQFTPKWQEMRHTQLADAYCTPPRMTSINRQPSRAPILSSNQATWCGEVWHKGISEMKTCAPRN